MHRNHEVKQVGFVITCKLNSVDNLDALIKYPNYIWPSRHLFYFDIPTFTFTCAYYIFCSCSSTYCNCSLFDPSKLCWSYRVPATPIFPPSPQFWPPCSPFPGLTHLCPSSPCHLIYAHGVL